ncbi:helix-turn-helix domain-containing protein [Chryseobacterium sediminis]|uniref:helix-turn-helix transcriptional regulator n=1 Tax=Chryseobacterium sediminis TaxID=1679494 RepID=UPI0028619677|nr:helix-turn-helix domain-containing protein [Chryseobacterium sediminis]MDR6462864.1 transcriptional regulator with XRE-family HTH domain [Chryseobacterium sediminis]
MQKEKLRNVRKRKGITQQQIADIIATDVSNYSRKESGDVAIRKEEWEKIARYLEVPVEEIYEEEDAKQINNFENNTNSNNIGTLSNNEIGTVSGNYYCNIPEFLLENQRDYIEHLKKENQRLQEEIKALQNK